MELTNNLNENSYFFLSGQSYHISTVNRIIRYFMSTVNRNAKCRHYLTNDVNFNAKTSTKTYRNMRIALRMFFPHFSAVTYEKKPRSFLLFKLKAK